MARRQTQGSETWKRLRDWDRGQTASERLAAHILRFAGYTSVDPSHPLGGRDGLKDAVCVREGVKWIAAAYFARGRQDFPMIRRKFRHDLEGVKKNSAEGIAFVTNQELSLGEREDLIEESSSVQSDLFHLERISHILDQPVCYGLRLEYLDIEMTKEEQLSFMAATYQRIEDLRLDREMMLSLINKSEALAEEFREMRVDSDTETPREPHYVTPISIGAPWEVILPSRETMHHRCSVCGFGFFVQDSGYRASVIAEISRCMVVTCPKCGNVDEI